jgi:beta-glucosidase
MFTRRQTAQLLVTAGSVGLVSKPAQSAFASSNRWPRDFLWGVATAGHQIEGNSTSSDYWVLEHIEGTNFKEPSGDACDSWNRWREDVALIKALGLNCYRFSIEWARIEPEKGQISYAALAHYRALCVALREIDVVPIVTFHHFVSPKWVAGQGGWENPTTADDFARYCGVVMAYLGEFIGYACTLNEPNAQVNSYVVRGKRPFAGEDIIVARASRAIGSDRFGSYFMGDSFKVRDVCIAAHIKGLDAIKSARPDLKVGMTLALQDLVKGSQDRGQYQEMFDNARLPFYQTCAKDDFIGVQPYMRLRTAVGGYMPAPDGVIRNHDNQDASPDVIAAVLQEVKRYCGAPIMITENGIDTQDDAIRARHLTETLGHLNASMASGIEVLGYIHWSLMDNFEWRSGYRPKFGLYSVDRKTFVRTPKPSAARYRALVRRARRS